MFPKKTAAKQSQPTKSSAPQQAHGYEFGGPWVLSYSSSKMAKANFDKV